MQSKSKRATTVWLIIVGLILSLVFISGAVAPQVQLGILALYVAMVLVGTGFFTSQEFRSRLPKPERERYKPLRQRRSRVRVSGAAEKAQARARNTPLYMEEFQLLDIGMIVNEVKSDGMHLRRGSVTLDDHGIQPYVVIRADSSWADETIRARFEILDQSGSPKFVHEEEVYLREGQNNILSGNRLPLLRRVNEHAPGMWELRVSMGDSVIGLHSFSVGPSMEERRRLIQNDVAQRHVRLRDDAPHSEAPDIQEDNDESPVSLEDLLRGHQ
jgi:hypothetical protein